MATAAVAIVGSCVSVPVHTFLAQLVQHQMVEHSLEIVKDDTGTFGQTFEDES